MPVRPSRVVSGPLADPSQHPQRGADRVAEDYRWNHTELFDRGRLAKARSRHAAYSHQCAVAKGAPDYAPMIQTAQNRREKTRQGLRATIDILNAECPDVGGIIAHAAAQETACLSKLGALQLAQCQWKDCFHGKSPGLRLEKCKLITNPRRPRR